MNFFRSPKGVNLELQKISSILKYIHKKCRSKQNNFLKVWKSIVKNKSEGSKNTFIISADIRDAFGSINQGICIFIYSCEFNFLFL